MNIQTIVYFDLESTGLKESGRPRISEISLVAVNTKGLWMSARNVLRRRVLLFDFT